jgi:hypothetical protein
VGKSTVELYCDLAGLQAPGGGSIPADAMAQAQRLDLVIIDRSVYGRFRLALVELTCPWDTDAKRAEERKTAGYADLKDELNDSGWDCGLHLIEVGARGHTVNSAKDCFWSLFRAWLPAGHRPGTGQMTKCASRTPHVCLFATPQARNDHKERERERERESERARERERQRERERERERARKTERLISIAKLKCSLGIRQVLVSGIHQVAIWLRCPDFDVPGVYQSNWVRERERERESSVEKSVVDDVTSYVTDDVAEQSSNAP